MAIEHSATEIVGWLGGILGALATGFSLIFTFGRKAQRLTDVIEENSKQYALLTLQMKSVVHKEDLDSTLNRLQKSIFRALEEQKNDIVRLEKADSETHRRIDNLMKK